jgi:hypothetical protein
VLAAVAQYNGGKSPGIAEWVETTQLAALQLLGQDCFSVGPEGTSAVDEQAVFVVRVTGDFVRADEDGPHPFSTLTVVVQASSGRGLLIVGQPASAPVADISTLGSVISGPLE